MCTMLKRDFDLVTLGPYYVWCTIFDLWPVTEQNFSACIWSLFHCNGLPTHGQNEPEVKVGISDDDGLVLRNNWFWTPKCNVLWKARFVCGVFWTASKSDAKSHSVLAVRVRSMKLRERQFSFCSPHLSRCHLQALSWWDMMIRVLHQGATFSLETDSPVEREHQAEMCNCLTRYLQKFVNHCWFLSELVGAREEEKKVLSNCKSLSNGRPGTENKFSVLELLQVASAWDVNLLCWR